MTDCEACVSLAGQSADVPPHQDLIKNPGTLARSDGELENYTCRTCGARWERFNTKANLAAEVHHWMRI